MSAKKLQKTRRRFCVRFVAHDKTGSFRSMNVTGIFATRVLALGAIGLAFAKMTPGLAERSRYFVSTNISWAKSTVKK